MLVSISTRCYIHNIVYTTQLSCVPLLGHTSPLFSREFLYLFSPLLETSSRILSSSQGFFLMSKSFMFHTNPNSFTLIISHYCTIMVRCTLTLPKLAHSILLRILFIFPYTISHNSLIQIPSLITPSSKSVAFRSFNYCIFSLYVPHWCTQIHSYRLLNLGSPSMPSLLVF